MIRKPFPRWKITAMYALLGGLAIAALQVQDIAVRYGIIIILVIAFILHSIIRYRRGV